MKELIIYVAEDGKRFDNEEDCRIYERTLITVNAKLFNSLKERITLNQLSELYYVILEDVASLEIIDNLLEEEGEPCISSGNFDCDELSYSLEFAPQLVYYDNLGWHWWNNQMAQLEDITVGLNYEY